MVGAAPFSGRLMTDHFKKFCADSGSKATPRVDATREMANDNQRGGGVGAGRMSR
jgi:hypothetical protein